MDLTLEHYSLDELLKLFKLPKNFTEQQLKAARKIVVSVHPDKSKLPNEYFLFFYNAYALLESIHKFNQRAQQNASEPQSFQDILSTMDDSHKRIIANQFTKNPSFNKEFNKLFDTLYIREDDGYGDWLKSDADLDVPFESRKESARAIVVNTIEPAAKNKYTDLKSVYTHDSVIGVSEVDFIHTETNVEARKTERARQIKPLNQQEASRILAKEREREGAEASDRMFKLLQQDKVNEKHQQTFWGKLMTLTQ
jgi:hypothetical protein